MDQNGSLNSMKWECRCHLGYMPKCCREVLYDGLREHMAALPGTLARQKWSRVVERHLIPGHVRMLLEIPRKYAVSQVVGYIDVESAIDIARTLRVSASEHGVLRSDWGAVTKR